METCGLCDSELTGKSGEGYLRIETVEGGRLDKQICARCLTRCRENWDKVQVTVVHPGQKDWDGKVAIPHSET